MYRVVGYQSGTVYYQAVHHADCSRWVNTTMSHMPKPNHRNRGHLKIDLPEPIIIEHVKAN